MAIAFVGTGEKGGEGHLNWGEQEAIWVVVTRQVLMAA